MENKEKYYVSLKLKPEVLIGKLLKALFKNEELKLALNPNDNTTPYAPDFKSIEAAVWVKESKYNDQERRDN